MSSPKSEQIEELMEQYRRQFAEISETQRKLREISCTATAARQVVAVTAAHGGAVSDIRFPVGAYKRMAPSELAAVIVKTIAEAQGMARREAAVLIAPTLPPGMDAESLLSGEADLRTFLPPEPELLGTTRDITTGGDLDA
ncbi:YbaB/EbfC family nucleoid-associated protein [Lentzea sp.]|uniref:YbaB/EbfC family nucleoid-associated protein n=1 Tax=Lentzea sp. TaxID=56099 RepID=UPI002ECFE4D0